MTAGKGGAASANTPSSHPDRCPRKTRGTIDRPGGLSMYGGRMKQILISVLALGFVAVAPVQAQADEETPLAKQMEKMNDAYKAFRRTRDPAEGARLARVAQQAIIEGMAMTPELVKNGTHPAGEEKAMAKYRRKTAELLVVFCKVEQAFLEEDFDKVGDLVDPIKEAKKEGHDEYMEE